MKDNYRLLAGVIAAHPNSQVAGRLRLQKTIKLLQCLGLPTDYQFSMHFYGPYSEDLQSDIGLLESLSFITEELKNTQTGGNFYIFSANSDCIIDEIKPFMHKIAVLSNSSTTALELAATYMVYRDMNMEHQQALESVRKKKKDKIAYEQDALKLLKELQLMDFSANACSVSA